MAYAAQYDDPQVDPEVRRRVMQRLQQPTGEPTAPGTPAPSASATPSPTFTAPQTPRAVTQKNEGNPAQPPETAPPASPIAGQAPGFQPFAPPPPGAPAPVSGQLPPTPIGGPGPSPWGDLWTQSGQNPQQFVQSFIGQHNLVGHQADPHALTQIVGALKSLGVNADLDQRSDGLHKGIMLNGQFVKLLDGSDRWIWDTGQGGGGDGGSSSAVPPGFGQTTNPFLEQIRQMLMERMGRDLQPVNENDSYISEPMSAARNEASRSSDAERKALAERLYASGGLNSNALETGIRQSGERTAIGLGSLRGQLIARELQARRQDLAEAFQGALASGDAQMARQVQEAIAQLDAMLRREGYGVSLAINTAGQNAATVGAGMNG